MIAVIQRVRRANVAVEATGYHAAINSGLCILLGVEVGDEIAQAEWIAEKIAALRIFRDDDGRMNRSVKEVGGEILLISQFTLAGDCRKGNRPSFVRAAPPEVAEPLYEHVARMFTSRHGLSVMTGQFGAMMMVSIENDGPVTLILERRPADHR